jgi:tRNA guanosine-2'-O-methyltransferase
MRWLRNHKQKGYYIIGLEQTLCSSLLNTFEYPSNPIVLLLGKEKEGIPVKYLHFIDQCIEIPQLGVIRSLNVHVSAAIAMWEYTRQKLMIQTDAVTS